MLLMSKRASSLACFVASCAIFLSMSQAVAQESKPKNKGIAVSTDSVRQDTWNDVVLAQGDIRPWEVAVISAKTSGISATSVKVLEGDNVEKGDVLAQFDDRLLKAELAQQRANLALAEANLALAMTNLNRLDQLKKNRTVSEQEFDATATEAQAAQARRDQAKAAVQVAEIRLADATVKAPDHGKILLRAIDEGEMPATGASLFQMLRQNKVEWVAEVSAQDVTKIGVGMAASVTTSDGRELQGKVRSISPQLTSNTRLANVRVVLDGKPDVPVNSFVQGRVRLGESQALTVPAESLVIRDGKSWVFRVRNGEAEQVSVKVGRRHADRIELLKGVAIGDVLAVDGAGFLNDGDKVNVTSNQVAGVK